MPKLTVYQQDEEAEYELGAEPVTLGRHSDSTIPIHDDQASRHHARIEPDGDKWFVVDLESSNGTFVDGRRISRHELKPGSTIRIGKTRITYAEAAADAGAEAPRATGPTVLRAVAGPLAGRSVRLGKGITRVGRAAENDLVLDDGLVSGHHADLIVDATGPRVVDRKSRNGVKVNQMMVTDHRLEPGDLVRMGASVFEIVIGAEPEPAAEPTPARRRTGLLRALVIAAAALVLALAYAAVLRPPDDTARRPQEHPGNVLAPADNPSFERWAGSDVPAWTITDGAATLEEAGVIDGRRALRLELPGGETWKTAACWAREATVHPGRAYRASALIENPDGAAGLAVEWRSERHPFLRQRVFAGPFEEGAAWRRAEQTFGPPSWATDARFGCALLGPGRARFDGVAVVRQGREGRPVRLESERVAVEPGPTGAFTLFVDGEPALGDVHVAVISERGSLDQSAATVERPAPGGDADSFAVEGTLGPAGPAFSQSIRAGADLGIAYKIALALSANVELCARSSPALLDTGVGLESAGGAVADQRGPFRQAQVRRITLFAGAAARRVFLRLSRAATVSTDLDGGGAVRWRIAFPPTPAEEPAVTVRVSAATAGRVGRVRALLVRGRKASASGRLGEAAAIYRQVPEVYPAYTAERAEAAERLKSVESRIAARVRQMIERAEEARRAASPGDLELAARAAERLAAITAGHEASRRLAGLAEQWRKQAAAAAKAQRAGRALAEAKRLIKESKPHLARWHLEYVRDHHPESPQAAEAGGLLAELGGEN
ncbi:MAG: FHA domain-containing protein [bacterium]